MPNDYCDKCKQATTLQARFFENIPPVVGMIGFFLGVLTPAILGVDLSIFDILQKIAPHSYGLYISLAEISVVILPSLVFYLVAAKVRGLYRRGLRINFIYPGWNEFVKGHKFFLPRFTRTWLDQGIFKQEIAT